MFQNEIRYSILVGVKLIVGFTFIDTFNSLFIFLNLIESITMCRCQYYGKSINIYTQIYKYTNH